MKLIIGIVLVVGCMIAGFLLHHGELMLLYVPSEYLIIGVPDPRGIFGHVPWAFVVPQDPEGWAAKTLIDHARHRLPPHMIPRRVVTIPEMPLIAVGKPDRRSVVTKYGPKTQG